MFLIVFFFCYICSFPNSKSITKVWRRKINSYLDSAFLERPSMVKLKNLTIATIPLGKSKTMLMKGRVLKRRNLQLPPGLLNAHLLRNSFYGTKIKEFKYSTQLQTE
jgi:hypothetical protein